MTWLPITYRDFHDVPRAFVVQRNGDLYFFDCPFDPAVDDYPDEYTVYRLPEEFARDKDHIPWDNPSASGKVVGRLPIAAVRLDPSKRVSVDDRIFELL
mgnify:CR=1 FL=1